DARANLVRYRVVEREDHERLAPRMEATDLHRRDVHVVLAEQRAHATDETGLVLMLRQKEMAVHGHVDPEAVDEDDPRVALHERSCDLRRSDLHREQRWEPRRLRLATLRDGEAARAREIEGVHEIHTLLAEGLEHTLHSGRPQRFRIELEDPAAVPERELRRPVIEELRRQRPEALREPQPRH